MKPPDKGLRERKMQKVRAQLVEAALELFTEQGFDATTVDEIAAKVEVSRRTFFRYFTSKEDVVLAFTDQVGEEIRAGLAARPEKEPPLTAVRRAVGPLVELYAAEKERALLAARLIEEAAAIRARHLDRQDRWQRRLADEIAKRLRLDAQRDLHPQLVAAVALTTIDVAVRAWLADGGRGDLSALVDEAFTTLEGGLNRAPKVEKDATVQVPAKPAARPPKTRG